jgi:hypothetical protein
MDRRKTWSAGADFDSSRRHELSDYLSIIGAALFVARDQF